MNGVSLLSEVHPGNMKTTNPVRQAHDWLGLVKDAEIKRWKRSGPPNLLQLIALCETRAKARGERLVLRDWTHLDYIGVPYVTPTFGYGVREALHGAYTLRTAVTVRHPIDQYVSTMKLAVMQGRLDIDTYLVGNVRFAQFAAENEFVRYEDFTRDPDSTLRVLCDRIGIDFDSDWLTKWASFKHVTGDSPGSGSRGSMASKILPLDRPQMPVELIETFRANANYQQTCELLGYEP